jgi:hypothetical protein
VALLSPAEARWRRPSAGPLVPLLDFVVHVPSRLIV